MNNANTQQTIETETNATISALTALMSKAPKFTATLDCGTKSFKWFSETTVGIPGTRARWYSHVVTAWVYENGKAASVLVSLQEEEVAIDAQGGVRDLMNHHGVPSCPGEASKLATVGEWQELARRYRLRAMQLATK